MLPTGMGPCIQTSQLKRQATVAGTLAIILPDLGATLWIPKYHRMSVMCMTAKNQVQIIFPYNMPVSDIVNNDESFAEVFYNQMNGYSSLSYLNVGYLTFCFI
jgi:translation elongation factor EF-4